MSYILGALQRLTGSVAASISLHAWANVLFSVFNFLPILKGENLLPFVGLMAGFVVAGYNRKHLIMLSDGFIALATLMMAISFLLGFRKIELMLIALMVRALGASVQAPAVSAIYPQLAPEEQLTKVQGINQTIGSISLLITPAIGGLLLGTVGIVGAFLVDIVTAAIAIGVMSRIHVEKPPMRGQGNGNIADEANAVTIKWDFGVERHMSQRDFYKIS